MRQSPAVDELRHSGSRQGRAGFVGGPSLLENTVATSRASRISVLTQGRDFAENLIARAPWEHTRISGTSLKSGYKGTTEKGARQVSQEWVFSMSLHLHRHSWSGMAVFRASALQRGLGVRNRRETGL